MTSTELVTLLRSQSRSLETNANVSSIDGLTFEFYNEKIFDLEYRKLNFNEKKMDNFSYVDVVKSNDLSIKKEYLKYSICLLTFLINRF